MQTIAAIILAFLKAFPALDDLVSKALVERARAREAEALARKQQKDEDAAEWMATLDKKKQQQENP